MFDVNQCIGANAGMARYQLTIEPWSAFLRYNRDSAIYQDMTVLDIIESIFKDYQGQGTLSPQWRLDIADPSAYPPYSLITQYQESDLAFIERLLSAAGLFSWVEVSGWRSHIELHLNSRDSVHDEDHAHHGERSSPQSPQAAVLQSRVQTPSGWAMPSTRRIHCRRRAGARRQHQHRSPVVA